MIDYFSSKGKLHSFICLFQNTLFPTEQQVTNKRNKLSTIITKCVIQMLTWWMKVEWMRH